MTDEPMTARAMAAAVARGEASALELCDAAIARIERLDGAINAVVVRDFERARDAARERDARRARGERSSLLGVPMTVKESLDIAGLPTTWGLAPYASFRPARDAAVVERLKAAGAVIVGKTNVPSNLADWQATNPIYGRTVNPHDPTRSPGGSSGGSAAALAAGLVPLEVGSDIGGSIRVPAHFCGVFGHKPTQGLVSMRGHGFPGSDGAAMELLVVGPLARDADDLGLLFDVLVGPDAPESAALRLTLPAPRQPGLMGARLLVLDAHPIAKVADEVKAALHATARAAANAGAQVAERSERLPDLAAAHKQYVAMLMTIISRGQPPGPEPVISAHAWFALLDARVRVRRAWAALFESFDAVLAPPFGTVAFAHSDEPEWARRTLAIDGEATPFGAQLAWPGMASFAGLPASVAPVSKNADGLPIGVQIIGPMFEDRTPLALVAALARLSS